MFFRRFLFLFGVPLGGEAPQEFCAAVVRVVLSTEIRTRIQDALKEKAIQGLSYAQLKFLCFAMLYI